MTKNLISLATSLLLTLALALGGCAATGMHSSMANNMGGGNMQTQTMQKKTMAAGPGAGGAMMHEQKMVAPSETKSQAPPMEKPGETMTK